MTPVKLDDRYLGVTRITRKHFIEIGKQLFAPGVLAEADPGVYYDIITSTKNERGEWADPLLILTIFEHESTCGRAGMAASTFSWGNTRPPSFGPSKVVKVENNFCFYENWKEGCRSTCWRLISTDWYYGAEERTIWEIWHDPIADNPGRTPAMAPVPRPAGDRREWAPAFDKNDPGNYANTVIRQMNAYGDQSAGAPPPLFDTSVPSPLFDTSRPAASGHYDGYATPRHVEAIVCHISDGSEAGDLQQLTTVVSSNYYINKNGKIYELVPPDHSAWTNGPTGNPDLSNPLVKAWVTAGVNPNTKTVSIEHEGKPNDRLTPAQVDASSKLIGWLCFKFGLPCDRTHIIGHYQIDSINRPYCPSFDPDEWDALLKRANMLLTKDRPVQVNAEDVEVPGIGKFTVGGGFYQVWNRRGKLAFDGFPLTNEEQENGRTVQYFERARYEWHPGEAPDNFDVMYGRLGAEVLEAQAHLTAVTAERDDLRTRLDAMTAERDKLKVAQVDHAQIATLTARLAEVEPAHAAATQSLADLQQAHDNLKATVSQQIQQRENAENQVADLTRQLDTLGSVHQTLVTDTRVYKRDTEKTIAELRTSILAVQQGAAGAVAEATDAVNAAEARLNQLILDEAQAREDLAAAQADLALVKRDMENCSGLVKQERELRVAAEGRAADAEKRAADLQKTVTAVAAPQDRRS